MLLLTDSTSAPRNPLLWADSNCEQTFLHTLLLGPIAHTQTKTDIFAEAKTVLFWCKCCTETLTSDVFFVMLLLLFQAWMMEQTSPGRWSQAFTRGSSRENCAPTRTTSPMWAAWSSPSWVWKLWVYFISFFVFFLICIFLGCLRSLKFLSLRASSIISLRPVCPLFRLSSPSLYPLLCRSSPCRTGVWCAAVACSRCLMPTSLISRNCPSYKERCSSSTTCCW